VTDPIRLGRYSLFAKLASGGMATVYLGRLNTEVGFGRTVAIKRLHPHLATEPEFVSMFLDEARLAARVNHPNVVPTLDVATTDGELFLVMDYVRGESLGALIRATCERDATIPIPIVTACAIGFLNGLHAAHEATDEQGRPLNIVHRDVSPQNVVIGTDGVARVLDFGVAKASMRLQTTRDGKLKGKLPYMPPEQIRGEISRATDVYASGVVLWEALACRRLYTGKTEAELLQKVMEAEVQPPSHYNPAVPAEVDRVTLKALAKDPAARYATTHEMAEELDAALRPASAMKVAEWVQTLAGEKLAERNQLVAEIESGSPAPDQPQLLRILGGLPPLDSTDASGPSIAVASHGGFKKVDAESTRSDGPPTRREGEGRARDSIEGPTTSVASSVARSMPPSAPVPATARPRWLIPALVAVPVLIGATFVLGERLAPERPAVVATPSVPAVAAAPAPPPPPSAPTNPIPSGEPAASAAPPASAGPPPSATASAVPVPSVAHRPATGTPHAATPAPTSSSRDIHSLLDTR
jgi:serine/threonine-protein kinase